MENCIPLVNPLQIVSENMAHVPGVFSDSLEKSITDARLLVVGAGGIGCELLKNIVLTGY